MANYIGFCCLWSFTCHLSISAVSLPRCLCLEASSCAVVLLQSPGRPLALTVAVLLWGLQTVGTSDGQTGHWSLSLASIDVLGRLQGVWSSEEQSTVALPIAGDLGGLQTVECSRTPGRPQTVVCSQEQTSGWSTLAEDTSFKGSGIWVEGSRGLGGSYAHSPLEPLGFPAAAIFGRVPSLFLCVQGNSWEAFRLWYLRRSRRADEIVFIQHIPIMVSFPTSTPRCF